MEGISKGHLVQIPRTHTGERPYTCSQCKESFSLEVSLILHQKLHTGKGDGPLTCTYCGKDFRDLSKAIRHQRIHTGERPYQCTECGKSFIRRDHLLKHWRVHTGETPYQCPVCGKHFRYKESLNCHQKIHSRNPRPMEEALQHNLESATQTSLFSNPCGLATKPALLKHPRNSSKKKNSDTKAWAPLQPRGVTWDLLGSVGLVFVVPYAGLNFACRECSREILWGSVFSRCFPTYLCAYSGVTSFRFHSFSARFTTRLDEGGREDAIPGPPAARPGCSDAPRASAPCHEAGLPPRGQR
uniref:C2H2-type domain-containing protein n=1 Tax=Meleagris gallopavo TaxID=9103 RepID=A0A803YGR6_MELGA